MPSLRTFFLRRLVQWLPKLGYRELSDSEKQHEAEIMKMYTETAKAFTQLSVAALLAPVVFQEKFSAGAQPTIDPLLIVTWVILLLATGAGLAYQYLAVKYLVAISWKEEYRAASRLVLNPGYFYGFMMCMFYLGAICLMLQVGYAYQKRAGSRPMPACVEVCPPQQ